MQLLELEMTKAQLSYESGPLCIRRYDIHIIIIRLPIDIDLKRSLGPLITNSEYYSSVNNDHLIKLTS